MRHPSLPCVLVLTAAVLEAQTILINDLKTSAAEWAKFAQVDAAKAETDVKAIQSQINPSMMWDDAGFAFTQLIFSKASPSVMLADPKKAGDHSVLQKLVDIGFGVQPLLVKQVDAMMGFTMNEPIEATMFQKARLKNPSPARCGVHTYMRRGWPWRPRMCIGPNVRFMPTNISQKFHEPRRSFSILLKTFGHQQ